MSILLQISSAQGPDECCLAVAKALARLIQEAKESDVQVDILEEEIGRRPETLRSVLLSLSGEKAEVFSSNWCGSLQWISESPYRPTHSRKNWFIGVARFSTPEVLAESDIRFEAIKSSGPGGQHVNKTDSAIRATHIASGISVKVQTERSQHANRRLARLLIEHKLEQQLQGQMADLKAERRMFHHQVERGNAGRVFKGSAFKSV